MDVDNPEVLYKQAVRAIQSNIYKNREVAQNAIQRFVKLQAQHSTLGTKNMFTLAILAKNEGIELTEINTFSAWNRRDKRISTLQRENPLYIYVPNKLQNGETVLVKNPVYDFSQTNAAQFGYKPKNSKEVMFSDNEEENIALLEDVKKHLSIKNITTTPSTSNFYDLNINTISVNKNETTKQNMDFIITQLVKQIGFNPNNFQQKTKDYEDLIYMSELEKQNMIGIISQGILSRFNIEKENEVNTLYFGTNLDEKLRFLTKKVGLISKKLDLDIFITNKIKEVQPKKPKIKKNKFIEFRKLTDEEKQALKDKGYEMIISANPEQILSDINANFEPKGGIIKINSIAGEPTKSTNFFIKDGTWRFNRFGGDGEAGDIIKFVMLETGLEYGDAINRCFSALDKQNPLTEAYEIIKLQNQAKLKEAGIDVAQTEQSTTKPTQLIDEIIENARIKNEELLKQNLTLEKTTKTNSRVVLASKEIPTKYITLMRDRGITKLPKEALYLKFEYKTNKDGADTTYLKEGIGLLCGDKEKLDSIYETIAKNRSCKIEEDWEDTKIGGDVHFHAYIDQHGNTRKTASAGKKHHTFIDNEGTISKKAAIFESKNDYFAASQKTNFIDKKTDVYVANGVGQWSGIKDAISANAYTSISLYTQNDIPAIRFAKKTLESYNRELKALTYSVKEFGMDPNDLLLANLTKKIDDRFKKFNGIDNVILEMADKMEAHINTLAPEDRNKTQKELETAFESINVIRLKQQELNLN